jgi:hypothetical protein
VKALPNLRAVHKTAVALVPTPQPEAAPFDPLVLELGRLQKLVLDHRRVIAERQHAPDLTGLLLHRRYRNKKFFEMFLDMMQIYFKK